MTSSPADFTPLSYEAIASLSLDTRRSMAMDFLDGGDLSRARAFLPLTPFLKKGSYGGWSFDKNLSVKTLLAAPPEWMAEALAFIKEAYAQSLLNDGANARAPRRFDAGDVLVQLSHTMLYAKQSSHTEAEAAARSKINLLLEDKDIELAGTHQAGYGQADLYSFVPAYMKNSAYVSPIGVAYAVEKQEPFLWRELTARPEWRARFDHSLFKGAALSHAMEESERQQPAILSNPKAWTTRPDLLSALLIARLEAERLSISPSPRLIHVGPLRSALFPSVIDTVARTALWNYLGEDSYPMAMGQRGAYCNRDEWSSSSFLTLFNRARAACPLEGEHDSAAQALFKDLPASKINDTSLADCLFSKDASLRQATITHYKPLLADGSPSGESPYRACLNAGLSRCLFSAASCGDPQAVIGLLDAMGPEAFTSHPGARKGMDFSALMVFAKHGDLEVFETALNWAERNGALDEAADARAWVMNEERTRKKGDLLALCVALADLDKASAFLKLRPDWKMTLARDTAKAMGEKLRSEKAGRAVSAWESLLFSKSIAIKTAPPEARPEDAETPEQAAPPRRARL